MEILLGLSSPQWIEAVFCRFIWTKNSLRTSPMAMTSILNLQSLVLESTHLLSASFEAEAPPHHKLLKNPNPKSMQIPISRREALVVSAIPFFSLTAMSAPSLARERRSRSSIPLEEYMTSYGLKYYDIVEGKGPKAEKGSIVQVHFDCLYRGITAVSSRESKLLAGNRIIAQPYEFTVGSPPGKERKREFVDNANGLYSAQAAPKPPPAMYRITEGMKVGGKRTVIVPSEFGYGEKGMNEIPPGATFELNVELLQVKTPGT